MSCPRRSGDKYRGRVDFALWSLFPVIFFTAKYLSNGNAFNIADYIGKNIIIVDFWYTHCPPCVRSMPLLSEFYDEYKDKGLKIFGFNTVDNQPESLENLKKFLSKRKVLGIESKGH